MVEHTADPQVRAQIMAMIGHCPSGSYTFALDAESGDIEPDLPQQIAATTEITDEGPIMGPLWVTGNIPIARADGQPFETRNRVTLCRCGLSGNKPLCDGTHRHAQQAAQKAQQHGVGSWRPSGVFCRLDNHIEAVAIFLAVFYATDDT